MTDLRNDRCELQAEIEQFREGVKTDTSRIAHLKDEEMKDDIEYLTSENKELHLKVKEVCLSRANLQHELAQVRKQLQLQEDRHDFSDIVNEANDDLQQVNASDIETARNIVGLEDDHFDPVEEVKDESSRLPDRGVKDFSD